MFCALKFHKISRKQTLNGSKYVSPYFNSFFSIFPTLILRQLFLKRRYRGINRPISTLQILISGLMSYNRENDQTIAFSKSRNWLLLKNATVDFSIVVLKIILISCVYRVYIKNHAQYSLFCENEYLGRIRC